MHAAVCSEKDLPNGKAMSCAEKNCMPLWPQQVFDNVDGVFSVSNVQVVTLRVHGLFQSPNIVRWTSEDRLDSSVENWRASVKTARKYQNTASAAVQLKVWLERLQQSCRTLLKKGRIGARAVSSNVLQDMTGDKVGDRGGVEVRGAGLCRRRHSETIGSLISLLLSVPVKSCGKASCSSADPRALLPRILCRRSAKLPEEYSVPSGLQKTLCKSA